MIPTPRPDDRVLLGAPLTTDLSQYEQDLAPSGAAVYEDPSARAAVPGSGRALEVELDIGSLSAGAILAVGREAPGEGYELTAAAGVISASVNGSAVATITPANLAAPSRYVIAWATEANPLATGAADAIRSELTAYDVIAQQLVRVEAAHEAAIVDEAHGLAVGGAWDGGAIVSAYTDTIAGARIAASFHPRPMIREHWVATTAAPIVDSLIAVEGPVLPSAVALSPATAGPQYAAAAQAMQAGRNRHRLASPLVQIMQRDPPDIGVNPALGEVLADTLGAKRVLVFGGGIQAPIGWVARRRVPRACAYVRVSVQWATWAPGGGAVDEVTLYAYASQGRPVNPLELQRRQITRAVEDGPSRFGVRETFDLLPVPRDGDGLTYLWLAAEVAGANVEWTLREITMVPVTVSPGFDEGDLPGGWGP